MVLPVFPSHILTTRQFLDRDLIEELFGQADRYAEADAQGTLPQILKGKILACVFYEPSTRTRFSFEAAMQKLGGSVIQTESAGHFSSAMKGETLEDSIRTIGGYADAIMLRHSEVGAAERAARVSSVPIINGGDGSREHPTQSLLDLYTIHKELGRMDKFHMGLMGDLLYGRTIHSLIYLLSLSNEIEVTLIAPPPLKLPKEYRDFLTAHRIPFHETDNLPEALPHLDVLYVTRIQKERFTDPLLYQRMQHTFILTKTLAETLPKHAIILHPLPRVDEIPTEVDADPRAAYFQQARNGLSIRMALLAKILETCPHPSPTPA
ncbi:aspartate carbamoyltransferase [Candidatus Peregrinibacteria bacterium]|nr:aspartate carbamoyltransferase [Candidatus Peregrinibacteria bacterium]